MLARRVGVAVVVYGLLATSAVLWSALGGRSPVAQSPETTLLGDLVPSPFARAFISIALGVAIAVGTVALTRTLVARTRWAHRLHVELRAIIGPLDARHIAFFAVSSGIAEELFFRGALQPAVGLTLASLVFGAVHIGPSRAFIPWTLWATAAGFVFGILYDVTGSLAGPIVAHVLVNYENMHFLVAVDPAPVRERKYTPDAPGLVGAPTRSAGRPADR